MRILASGFNGSLVSYVRGLSKAKGCGVADYKHAPLSEAAVLLYARAFTDVDACERDPNKAWKLNVEGPANAAQMCRGHLPIVYISSDFQPGPSVYGRTKHAGETAVKCLQPDNLIVKLQSLYGIGGKSWASKIANKLVKGETVYAIDDQMVQPTYYKCAANFLLDCIRTGCRGEKEYSAVGCATWYDFAIHMNALLGNPGTVKSITSGELKREAVRPTTSVFMGGHGTLDWEGMLKEYIEEFLGDMR